MTFVKERVFGTLSVASQNWETLTQRVGKLPLDRSDLNTTLQRQKVLTLLHSPIGSNLVRSVLVAIQSRR